MDLRFTRTKCNCKECPLSDRKRVRGIANFEKPKVAIIGEAPGENEDNEGLPFVGAAGAKLKQAVNESGLVWHTVYKTNVILCRPPNNKIDGVEGRMAIECCMPGFMEEVEWLGKTGVTVIVPTGNTALSALGLEGKIGKVRGSVYEVGKMVAVPTYHPAFILRGMWKEEPTWINDLRKARDLAVKGWSKPKEKFNLFPTVEDVVNFVADVVSRKILVGVDLETTGFNENYAKILMIGLAKSGEEALVVPFTKKGGVPYWKELDELKVTKALRVLFKEGRLAFQNASFDVKHLMAKGYEVGAVAEDTMLCHHAINPELPHNLGYIVSIYGKTPFWKDVVLGSEDRMVNMDDEIIRTYNARDSVVLLQVLPNLHRHLKEVGTEKTYRDISLKLVLPLVRMSLNGLPIDRVKMKSKAALFKRRAKAAEKKLREICKLPEGFNLDSGDHMRLLVWGSKPKSYDRLLEEKVEIDGNAKRRKDTKKYKEIVERLRIYESVVPLYRVESFGKVYAKAMEEGSESLGYREVARRWMADRPIEEKSVDAEAMLAIHRGALNRLEDLKLLTRRTEKHRVEEERIKELLTFVKEYGKYKEAQKLASTFTGFPVGPDGRVHPSYKIHGTATGRLSSADPNAQNIPGEVQDIFVAPAGYDIVKADYSNIELRVLGYITGEPVIMDAFEKGINIHDVNCKLLFGIDEKHPMWSDARRAAKVYIFGRSYGGGVEGIYQQIITAVPELELSFDKFKKMDEAYFRKLSKYKAWTESQKEKARKTRCVETAFGRKRFLLGTPNEIERMALNTPIQGTAGEIALRAIVELDAALLKRYPHAKIITTVHDSILVMSPTSQTKDVAKLMKRIMEKEYTIEGRKVRFPVDIEVGPSWGETAKIKV